MRIFKLTRAAIRRPESLTETAELAELADLMFRAGMVSLIVGIGAVIAAAAAPLIWGWL